MNNNVKSRRSLWLILFLLIFAVGFTVGAAVQKGERINTAITGYAENTVNVRISGDAAAVFLDSLISYLIVLITVCFLGINKSGAFLNAVFILFFGLGKGALISNLVCDSGIHGLSFSVFVLLPGMTAVTSAVLLLASLSADLCFAKNKKQTKLGKQRLSALFIYTFITIFSAGLDAVFSVLYKVLA